MCQIVWISVCGIGTGIRKGRDPVSLHRDDICASRKLFDHSKHQHYGKEALLEGRIAKGQNEEPCRTGNEDGDAVGDDGGEKATKTGRSTIQPAAQSTGEKEDAYGFGNATEVRDQLFRDARLKKAFTHFIDVAVRSPGNAA